MKIIRMTGPHLLAVYFELGPIDDALSTDDAYTLSVYLVYKVSVDPQQAEAVATSAAASIRDLFKQSFFQAGKWQQIEPGRIDGIFGSSHDDIPSAIA